jgi:hypothetical protein
MPLLFITGIIYLVYWIVQAVDANRLAKKFNRHLDKEGAIVVLAEIYVFHGFI